MKEIEITIGPDGDTEIDLKGYHGHGCANVVDELTKALGESVTRKQKAEFYKVKPKIKIKQKTK